MAVEKVKEYLKQYGMEDKIFEFSESSAIELTIDELEKYSNYIQWSDVCKGWND